MRTAITILLFFSLVGCSGDGLGRDYANDPIVSINLSERRGQYRLETSIDRSGNVFRGYYEQSFDHYQKSAEFTLTNPQTKQLWAAIDKGPFPESFSSYEPNGNFKMIGATWQGASSAYGVSAEYKDLSVGSPLEKTLEIIRKHEIDKWIVPVETDLVPPATIE